jgi:hypothetical protein
MSEAKQKTCQDNRCLGRDSNGRRAEYNLLALPVLQPVQYDEVDDT